MCNYTLLLIRNHTEALLCNPHVLLCNPKNCWCCFSSVWQALLLVTLSIGYFGFLATFSPTYGWMLLLRGLVGCGMGGSTQGCGRKSLSFSWPCWPMSAEVVYLISNLYLLVFSGEQAETGCFIQKLCIITFFFFSFCRPCYTRHGWRDVEKQLCVCCNHLFDVCTADWQLGVGGSARDCRSPSVPSYRVWNSGLCRWSWQKLPAFCCTLFKGWGSGGLLKPFLIIGAIDLTLLY